MYIRPFQPLNTYQLTNNKTSMRPVLSHPCLQAHNPTTYLSREADENKTVCVSSISTTHFVPKSISVESQERQGNSHTFKLEIKAYSFLSYKHDLPLPRRLKGLTRTATLTLELIPGGSAFQQTTGFLLRRFINVETP